MDNPFEICNPRDIYRAEVASEWKENETKRGTKLVTSWHASGSGSCPCGRYIGRFAQELGIETVPYDERTLSVFDVGNDEEERFFKKVERNKEFKFDRQVGIKNTTHGLSGYIDGLVTHIPTGQQFIWEVKSKHSRSFWYMTKERKPNDHHAMQTWWYLDTKGIDHGFIVYLSKDDREVMQFLVNRNDPALQAKCLEEIGVLNYALQANFMKQPSEWLLPKPAEPNSWQAKYCQYHKACKELEKLGRTMSLEQEADIKTEYLIKYAKV